MIKISNLSKSFNNKKILDDLNFTLNDEIVAIVGKSGCGKSTLLKILSNFILADSGIINIDEEIYDLSKENFLLKSKFGFMFQNNLLFSNLNAYENVTLGLKISNKPLDNVDEILKEFEIYDDRFKMSDELSGGMAQRVELARVFVMKKKYYLFDEPFSKLDYLTKYKILNWFKKTIIPQINGALFITHDIDEAIFLADRILLLDNNKFIDEFIVSGDKNLLKSRILKNIFKE